jgi:Uma2 family endonuclease
VGVPTIKTGPMTVEEFYAFTDARPDGEKWELLEGEPVLNASPSRLHQRIIKNLTFVLATIERESEVSWEVLPGLGVRVSETNRPEPDVLIFAEARPVSRSTRT